MLYAVTDRSWAGNRTLCEQVEAALKGGVTMVQYREKRLGNGSLEPFLEEAGELRRLTEHYGVPLIIDDSIDLALRCGADGVHVGQDDLDAGLARQLLGPERILGVTARTVEQAKKAQAQGADYIGSGAVFGTQTKADAKPMSLDMFREICASVSIPVVAIGGIGPENIHLLSGTGTAGAAVVSGLFGAEDVEERARELKKKMEKILQKSN